MSETPTPYVAPHVFGPPNAAGVAPVYPAAPRRPLPPATDWLTAAARADDLIAAALEVLDRGDELLELVERASAGLPPRLLAAHAARRWSHARAQLLDRLEALSPGAEDQP